jgi:hypothetical protein
VMTRPKRLKIVTDRAAIDIINADIFYDDFSIETYFCQLAGMYANKDKHKNIYSMRLMVNRLIESSLSRLNRLQDALDTLDDSKITELPSSCKPKPWEG